MNRSQLLIAGCILVIIGVYGLLRVGVGRPPATPVPRDAPAFEQLRSLAGLPPGDLVTPATARAALLTQLHGNREPAVQAFLAAHGMASDPHAINRGMDENGYHWKITLAQCSPQPSPQPAPGAPGARVVTLDFVFQAGGGPLQDIDITASTFDGPWMC